MTCDEAVELISALLDGELGVPDVVLLQYHLEQCGPCRTAHASDAWLHSLLAVGALLEAPSDALRLRIREAIAREVPAASAWRSRWRRARLPVLLAGTLALLAAVSVLLHDERPKDSPILADVLDDHREYLEASAPRLDISGRDAARLEQWMLDSLGLMVKLPAGAGRGEIPVGARVATIAGARAAHVIYAGKGRQVSLFVARRPAHPIPEEDEHIVDGMEVYTTTLDTSSVGWWQDRRYLYVAVSTAGREDLLELAALCIRSQRAPRGRPSPLTREALADSTTPADPQPPRPVARGPAVDLLGDRPHEHAQRSDAPAVVVTTHLSAAEPRRDR